MLQRIYRLLTISQRKRSIGVVLTVLARAILDFAGVAALIPILFTVLQPGSDRNTMLMMCGAVMLFVAFKNGLVVWLARIQSKYQLNIYESFSRRMFINYYRRGLLYLKSKSSVHLGHEVNYVCYMFSQSVLSPIFRMAGESILTLMMLTALIVWEPVAGLLLCAVFFPLAAIYAGIIRKKLRRYGEEELDARRKQSRTVIEAFRGYPELEIAQAFYSSLDRFDEGIHFIVTNRLRMEIYQLMPAFLSELAITGGLTLLIATGQGNLGIVSGVFAVAAFRLVPAVRNILNSWIVLQNASHTIAIVEEGISNEYRPGNLNSGLPFRFKKGIQVDRLGFSFPDGHTLFSNLNLNIERGDRLGIKGASGSGKSTLFNLMLGFFEPTIGRITIDGQPLTPDNRHYWHTLVGYVPQEIFIIEGTLADNIALGKEDVDYPKVWEVLEQVQLKEWAEQLSMQLNTSLGEYGSRLSGGQKQRIGIARALYKNAEVLFFDEATSSLDNRTEQEINQALQMLSRQHRELTLIIIAHRESSLAFCNKIFDLDDYVH